LKYNLNSSIFIYEVQGIPTKDIQNNHELNLLPGKQKKVLYLQFPLPARDLVVPPALGGAGRRGGSGQGCRQPPALLLASAPAQPER